MVSSQTKNPAPGDAWRRVLHCRIDRQRCLAANGPLRGPGNISAWLVAGRRDASRLAGYGEYRAPFGGSGEQQYSEWHRAAEMVPQIELDHWKPMLIGTRTDGELTVSGTCCVSHQGWRTDCPSSEC